MTQPNNNNNNNNKFKTVTNVYTGETTDTAILNTKEIEIIKKLVTKDDVVMDIGANVGFMTTVLAQHAKHVYAFEPSPDNFKQLVENTKHLKNVDLYDIAVSNEVVFKKLYLCPLDPGMNRLYDSKWCKGGKKVEVPTTTLDFWMKFVLERISFIKMDIEGYEYQVLEGAKQLLKRDHPIILMEFHPPSIEESGAKPEDIYNLLKDDLGYKDPINCNTDGIITSYEKLDENTRNCPAVNILWMPNK